MVLLNDDLNVHATFCEGSCASGQRLASSHRKVMLIRMDKIRIKGGRPCWGTVEISGAKRMLPCRPWLLLLTSDAIVLQNVPYVRDIQPCNDAKRSGMTLTSGHSSRPIRAASLRIT
jgi:hypothetical protein